MNVHKRQEIEENIKAITGSDWQDLFLICEEEGRVPVFYVNRHTGQGNGLDGDGMAHAYVLRGLRELGAPEKVLPKRPKASRLGKIMGKLLGRAHNRNVPSVEDNEFTPRYNFEQPDPSLENDPWLDRLAPLSLRGRIALALCILENAIQALSPDTETWNIVLDHYWNFVGSSKAYTCHLDFLLPEFVLSQLPDKILNGEEREKMRKVYAMADPDVLKMLEYITWAISVWELGLYLKNGISCSIRITALIKLAISRSIPVPDLMPFMAYMFDKGDPWAAEPGLLRMRRKG